MLRKSAHPSDQDLLLAADGELSPRRSAQVRSHLAACWHCRARMAELEETITDFARMHRNTFDPRLPPIAGARERLRSQLAQLAAEPPAGSPTRTFQVGPTATVAACVGMAILIIAIVGNSLIQHFSPRPQPSAMVGFEPAALPNPSLTPGATRQVAVSEVCVTPHEQVVKSVPSALRQQVLLEYKIANANPDNYEIDYLIAPGLGGREDIRNLWPQPRTSLRWNSEVKDALEEHLHGLVCSGKLDLVSAQHDIASDWIAAYKRYFNVDKPLPPTAGRFGLVGALVPPSTLFER